MKTLIALLTGAKFGKVLLTSGTMLLSVVTYSFIFGWWYAVGFVGLIFCHEMGHFWLPDNADWMWVPPP